MIELEACAVAGEMVKSAGFEHRKTSIQSEATYYGWPGRNPVLRIACHKAGSRELDGVPIIATVTFNPRNFKADTSGLPVISRAYVIRAVASAIGNYMLASSDTVRARSRYRKYWSGGEADIVPLDILEC